MEKIKERIADFGALLNYADTEYTKLKELINSCEDEIHEIEHNIEFEEIDPYRAYVLLLKIKEVRLRRRGYKNERLILNPIKMFINDNKNFDIKTFKLVSDIKHIENDIKNFHYNPKIRKDLQFSEKTLGGVVDDESNK